MLKFIRYEFDIINLESKIRIYLYIQNIHFISFDLTFLNVHYNRMM